MTLLLKKEGLLSPMGEPQPLAWLISQFLTSCFASDPLPDLSSLSGQEVQQNSEVSGLRRNHFHKRGIALWGKSSPDPWGKSGAEPPFPGEAKIFLVISQSCPTIWRRTTRYCYMYLYRVITSARKHFRLSGKSDLPFFVSSEPPASEDGVRNHRFI